MTEKSMRGIGTVVFVFASALCFPPFVWSDLYSDCLGQHCHLDRCGHFSLFFATFYTLID